MLILALDPARARTTTLSALLGGLGAGLAAPYVLATAGPVATAASVASLIAGTTLVARRGSSVVARSAIAGGLALVAAAAESWIHAGPAVAILGLGVGLALAPEGLHGGLRAALARAVPASALALLGAIAVGAVARIEPFASLAAPGWGALLGGAIGLGAGLGEALRASFTTAPETLAEVDAARAKALPETRPLVESAQKSYGRVVEAVQRSLDMTGADKVEALATARELALATARQALAGDELARMVRSVPAGDPSAPGARERIEASLGQRRDAARVQAGESAAALAELALALTERVAPRGPALEDEDLASRARGLAFRLNGRDPVTIKG